jgi:short-subunit dehydrogenase
VDIRDRSVLLTGATGGIGHAIARELAGRGARLILTGRRAEVLEPLARETGGLAVACDLSDRAALDRLVDEHGGGVDALVSNAAMPASGPLLEYTADQIDRALDVNLRAPMHLARRLGESMAARRSGHIVFVSSMSGKAASPGTSVYSATKYGLRGFALALREDLRPAGVGVSTIFPHFIRDAGMFADAGVKLPPFAGTRTSGDVATAVLRAIERNRAEVDVAPAWIRVGAALAGIAPATSAAVQRRLGSERISADFADAQRHLR